MLTEKEINRIVDAIISSPVYISNEEEREAMDILNKSIPQMVGRWKDGSSFCPRCERGVVTEDIYCSYCGQKLKR